MTIVGEGQAPSEWVGVGQRIRQAREASHISVRELARRVDVSPSHISNVERGLAALSVRALYNIVSELGITMDSLFVEGEAQVVETDPDGPAFSRSETPSPERGALEAKGIVLRRDGRPSIPLPTGTRWERLTPSAEMGAEFIEVIYPPRAGAAQDEDFTMHSSREYGVITQGSLTIQVGFDTAVLRLGDSIAFDSTTPHRYWNATDEEVRAVWFIWDAPTFADAASPDDTADEKVAPTA